MAEERTDIEQASPGENMALTRPGYPRAAYPEAYVGGYGYGEACDKINLREVWRILRKRKLMIAVVAIVVTTIVIIAAFQSKSIYQASATIEVEKENHTLVRSGDVVTQTDDGGDDRNACFGEGGNVPIDGADTRREFLSNVLRAGYPAPLHINQDSNKSVDAIHRD